MKHLALGLCSLTMLSGCAAIFDGTSQQMTINTNPSGASCSLDRKGTIIGTIPQTPGSTRIDKTKDDITVACTKEGYQQATYLNHSGVAGATYADIIGGLLGLIGWGVDSSTGADNKYDNPINISMVPLPQPVAPVAAPAPEAPPPAMQQNTPAYVPYHKN